MRKSIELDEIKDLIPAEITPVEMGIIDQNSEWLGVPTLLLMENAGRAVVNALKQELGSLHGKKVFIFAGTGNNGGDSFVVARHLASENALITVFLLGNARDMRTEIAKKNWDILKNMQCSIVLQEIREVAKLLSLKDAIQKTPDIIIDGLLGTGIKGKIREPISSAINLINGSSAFKISIDVPSGVDPLTGMVPDKAIIPNLTITFHKNKVGLTSEKITGKLIISSIGIPPEAELFVGRGDLNAMKLARPPTSHKGDFGKVLVIGGSAIYSGAPALVALAAYRTGADLVQLLVPSKIAPSLRSLSADLIIREYNSDYFNESGVDVVKDLLKWATVVAIGPGLGPAEKIKQGILELLGMISSKELPFVLDADGLKAIKGNLDLVKGSRGILTPHLGEYGIISDKKIKVNSSLLEKLKDVSEFARNNQITLLLKGSEDIISNGERMKINITGNPAMTVGGTGDVLTGICVGLLAQNIDPFRAACCGAFINGLAGDLAIEKLGGPHLLATDLIDLIPEIMQRRFG
ncbi:MAG: NAD(P)H-hydrate dehydratase [Candidatus Helarchaeota archaeon]